MEKEPINSKNGASGSNASKAGSKNADSYGDDVRNESKYGDGKSQFEKEESQTNFSDDAEGGVSESAKSEINLDNFVPKFLFQSLEQENKNLKVKVDEVLSAHRRAIDEQQKMVERLKADAEKQVDFKVIKIFRDFLDTIDNLDRTLNWSKQSQNSEVKNFGVGLEMIMNGFKEKLRVHQIEMFSLLGKVFDPTKAEAVEQLEVSKADQEGIVLEESTHGYVYRGHLIRAAQVKVGRFSGKK